MKFDTLGKRLSKSKLSFKELNPHGLVFDKLKIPQEIDLIDEFLATDDRNIRMGKRTTFSYLKKDYIALKSGLTLK